MTDAALKMALADDLRYLRYGTDPIAFCREVLHFHPDEWQERFILSAIKPGARVIVLASRQAGKSKTIAAILVWLAVFEPGCLLLIISASARQASETLSHALDFLKLLEPVELLDEENKKSCKLQNGSRIVSLPADARTVRGYSGPRLCVEDESGFVPDECHEALTPSLAASNGGLVLSSTPYGQRGHFFNIWTEGGSWWHRIMVTADQCPRITPEFLAQERAIKPSWRIEQEYFCSFSATTDGQIFSMEVVRAAFDQKVKPLFTSDDLLSIAARGAA